MNENNINDTLLKYKNKRYREIKYYNEVLIRDVAIQNFANHATCSQKIIYVERGSTFPRRCSI